MSIEPSRWAQSGREVLALAGAEALRSESGYVGTEHLVMALLKLRDAGLGELLATLGIDADKVRHAMRDELAELVVTKTKESPSLTPRLARVMSAAEESNRARTGAGAVESVDLLAALLEDARGTGLEYLRKVGANLVAARTATRRALSEAPSVGEGARTMAPRTPGDPADDRARSRGRTKTPILDDLGRDLTEAARAGKLVAPIGRDDEIRSLAQVLMHKLKANPVLIGHPGVGKTCIVEGLALRASLANAPKVLAQLRFVELQPAALVAGASHQGDLEERVRGVIEEVRSNSNVVLFLDELHTLLSVGFSSGGAANILKPALARSDFRCIGATTIAEYRRHIEKDGALERRFHVIKIEEPSRDHAVEILRGLRESLESHHGLKITDEALVAAVELSLRFMTDRYLPDKALDLVDHACSMQAFHTLGIATAHDAGPPNVDRQAITRALSALRGIAMEDLEAQGASRMREIDVALRERVVGQEEAIGAVSSTIQARMAGLSSTDRPAVLMFVGPSGVGKTELAKALAAFLFRDDQRLVRIDMSEYTEPHSVARLIGAPPGYIGHDDEGQLTGQVRTNPHTIVLFDELEKAHPKVFDLFLQIFDEGHLTDSRGRRVDFRNTVVVMTSNIGDWGPIKAAKVIRFRLPNEPDAPSAEENVKARRDSNMKVIEQTFRPELLGRIDKIVFFDPLGRDEVRAVARRMLDGLRVRVEAQGVTIEVEDSLVELLVDHGFSEATGARKMRAAVDTRVREPLAKELLSDDLRKGTILVLGAADGKLRIARKEPE
jgi:ATP-dependent Clp protease ATP-binding subunit ClpC